MFYERDTTDQILSLARVTTLGRLRAGLSYLLEAHGFRYYTFTCHTVEPGGACCTAVIHNLPSGKNASTPSVGNAVHGDPLAQYALNETLPVDWRSLMNRPEYQGRTYRAAMNRRARRGMRSGCTVPLLQGYGALAWLDLALDRDDESAWAHIRQYLPYATLLGRVVLDKTRRLGKKTLSAADVSSEPLDERERACLRGASEGLGNAEIGALLGISERTVSNHIHRACEKLHARNRQHAITKALLSRQLYACTLPLANEVAPIY